MQVTYIQTLHPIPSGLTLKTSRMVAAKKYFLAATGTSIIENQYNVQSLGSQTQTIVFSSNSTETCQTVMFTTQATGTLVQRSNYVTEMGATLVFSPSTIGINTGTVVASATIDIDEK